jgi:hypothetical protein
VGKKRTTGSSGTAAGTTGARASTAARKSEAGAKDPQCDWTASSITKPDEKKLRNLGLISANEGDVIFLGSDSRPKPPKGFTVMFAAFLYRGMSLPAPNFSDAFSFLWNSALAADSKFYSAFGNLYYRMRGLPWH